MAREIDPKEKSPDLDQMARTIRISKPIHTEIESHRRRLRVEREELGDEQDLCTKCRKRPRATDRRWCETCAERHRLYKSKSYKKVKKETPWWVKEGIAKEKKDEVRGRGLIMDALVAERFGTHPGQVEIVLKVSVRSASVGHPTTLPSSAVEVLLSNYEEYQDMMAVIRNALSEWMKGMVVVKRDDR